MKGSLLLALLTLAPTEVVVREGESLAQVAQRTLGDRAGASELKALNGLKDDAVRPGTKLKLPGPDRTHAQTALDSARSSVAQADSKSAARLEEAEAKLKEAEAHFQNARYEEAAQAADGVWKLLSERPPQPTKVTMVVDDKGGTTVRAVSGKVTVEGGGTTRVVEDGGTVYVEKGQPPRPLLSAPRPTRPADRQRVSVRTVKSGPEPISLAWQAVEGAEGYEVELVPTRGERRVLSASGPHLKVALPAGAYRWSVRALARDARSEPSPEQGFEVEEAAPKIINLQVQPQKWK